MLISESDYSCMSTDVSLHVCVCLCITIRLLWGTATAESHDNGSKSKASLHTVLPDAFQNVEREVDVQITQKHNAVTILQEETQTNTFTSDQY